MTRTNREVQTIFLAPPPLSRTVALSPLPFVFCPPLSFAFLFLCWPCLAYAFTVHFQDTWRSLPAEENLQERQQGFSRQEASPGGGKPSQRLVKEKFSKAFPNAVPESKVAR